MGENTTVKKARPRPLPGFEVGYYPPEWLYGDDGEHQAAGPGADPEV
ncbi:MAG: hypothetical protein PHP51_02120 [Desulfotomaculaceae bacterium]|nr:hypothetical protein [Desulfotomaculaceae bacterium]MDD4766490.1 hypothetical protein [Desulfotomaculaceae bacterium]